MTKKYGEYKMAIIGKFEIGKNVDKILFEMI
jgi:hypothetical protein